MQIPSLPVETRTSIAEYALQGELPSFALSAKGSFMKKTVKPKSKVNGKVKQTLKQTTALRAGKENQAQAIPLKRPRKRAKLESLDSSDTLVASSSPIKIKSELASNTNICAQDLNEGAYIQHTRAKGPSPSRSSPLPPSSPPPLPPSSPPIAVVAEKDGEDVEHAKANSWLAALKPVRKSRRLLGLCASPVPRNAPPALRVSFRSRDSSPAAAAVDCNGNSRECDWDEDADAESVDGDGGSEVEDDEAPCVLHLPDDMRDQDDGYYTTREAWFEAKLAEYERPSLYIEPTFHVLNSTSTFNSSFISTSYSTPEDSGCNWKYVWTPPAYTTSIAYSRSPCTTLGAILRESRSRLPACDECVGRGVEDARDCEGSCDGICLVPHVKKHVGAGVDMDVDMKTGMGMDTGMAIEINLDGEAEAEENMEDAPWCVNGARVRYDGSVVGACWSPSCRGVEYPKVDGDLLDATDNGDEFSGALDDDAPVLDG